MDDARCRFYCTRFGGLCLENHPLCLDEVEAIQHRAKGALPIRFGEAKEVPRRILNSLCLLLLQLRELGTGGHAQGTLQLARCNGLQDQQGDFDRPALPHQATVRTEPFLSTGWRRPVDTTRQDLHFFQRRQALGFAASAINCIRSGLYAMRDGDDTVLMHAQYVCYA